MIIDSREELLAKAAELRTLADLVEKYPAEAQLIMAALEDGLKLGPMQVSEPRVSGSSRVITVSSCAGSGEVCRLDDCAKPAGLVMAMADDASSWLWCLDHWAALGELVTAGGVTSFDREALELIEARHAARPR